jgi:hypothetical protein
MKKRFMDFNERRASQAKKTDLSKVSLQSYTTAMPNLISSFCHNYKDKTLSIKKYKRFLLKKHNSIFKFRNSVHLRQHKRKNEGQLELSTMHQNIRVLQLQVEEEKKLNQNNEKRLKLVRYIAKSTDKQIKGKGNKTTYFKSYLNFIDKIKNKKQNRVDKMSNIDFKMKMLADKIRTREEAIKRNRKTLFDLNFKRTYYDKLKAKNYIVGKKRKELEKKINERDTVVMRHQLVMENENVQKNNLNDSMALYLVKTRQNDSNIQISQLISQINGLEARVKQKKLFARIAV